MLRGLRYVGDVEDVITWTGPGLDELTNYSGTAPLIDHISVHVVTRCLRRAWLLVLDEYAGTAVICTRSMNACLRHSLRLMRQLR
jgi:hypothetical protein